MWPGVAVPTPLVQFGWSLEQHPRSNYGEIDLTGSAPFHTKLDTMDEPLEHQYASELGTPSMPVACGCDHGGTYSVTTYQAGKRVPRGLPAPSQYGTALAAAASGFVVATWIFASILKKACTSTHRK